MRTTFTPTTFSRGPQSSVPRRARQETDANRKAQGRHDAIFAGLFSDVDLKGGRYILQEMSFSGSLSFYQGEREVRVLELGVGHSESDVVVHLPGERIVFAVMSS